MGTRARRTPFFDYERDFFGRVASTKKTRIAYADMTFDEHQLKSIAEKTGGRYFPVDDRDSLEKALDEIDKLEKTELEADSWDRWNEHFASFLLLGALLVFAAVSLSMASARRMA